MKHIFLIFGFLMAGQAVFAQTDLLLGGVKGKDGGSDSTWQLQPIGFIAKRPNTPIWRTGQVKIENNRIIFDKLRSDSISNSLNGKGKGALSIRTIDFPQLGQNSGTLFEAQIHTNTGQNYKPTWRQVYSTDTVQNLPNSTIGNYVTAFGWNINENGTPIDTSAGGISMNFEANYNLNAGPDRATEWHLVPFWKGNTGGARVLTGAFSHSKFPATIYRTDFLIQSNHLGINDDQGNNKWSWNFGRLASGPNVVTVYDTGTVNFVTANYYPLSQNGLNLIGQSQAGYMGLAGGRFGMSTSTPTPEIVTFGGSLGFGNSTYPILQGPLFTSSNSELLKLTSTTIRPGEVWRLQNDASGNLSFSDAAVGTLPFSLNRAAPNNSLTVASTGNVGVGTSGSSYPFNILNTGSAGGAVLAVTGLTTPNVAAMYANGTITGAGLLYDDNVSATGILTHRMWNNNAASSSADMLLELATSSTGGDPFIRFSPGSGSVVQPVIGVLNDGNDDLRATRGPFISSQASMIWKADRTNFVSATGTTEFVQGLVATPVGSVTANPGALAGVNDGTNGFLYGKYSGTGNLNWGKFLNLIDPNGASTNQVLAWNGTSWAPATNTSESTKIGAFTNTATNQGLVLSADSIKMTAADITHPGGVNLTAQVFSAGTAQKTISADNGFQLRLDDPLATKSAGFQLSESGGTNVMVQVTGSSPDTDNGLLQVKVEHSGALETYIEAGGLNDKDGVYQKGGQYIDVKETSSTAYTVLYGDRVLYFNGSTTTVTLQEIGVGAGQTKGGRFIEIFNDTGTDLTIQTTGGQDINSASTLIVPTGTGVKLCSLLATAKWITLN